MTYLNEHLWPGIFGKFSILLACLALFIAFLFFLMQGFGKPNAHLKRMAKSAYVLHVVFLLIASFMLFYIIFNHYFEYNYVWRHSALNTPLKYIISCFWAGQEGSFLVWILMQGLMGLFFIRKSNVISLTALGIMSVVQLILLTNILGIQIFGFQLGASPFVLLREVSDDPLFKQASYLLFLTDGNGLNPLLLNPWMVSHPPLIFLGYAMALPPYALTLGALVHRDFKSHLDTVIVWVVMAVFTLGIGIIIGGAWAYESLTFGGFWAWDPVENASLVPWLILLAGLHLIIIARKDYTYLVPASILISLGYILVVYASFLTRSGVLSETSVHSFSKDSVYTFQLTFLLITVFVLPIIIFIKRIGFFQKTDNTSFLSRGFFTYMGSVFLALSAFHIIFSTSIPVINKLFGSNLAPPLNREAFYNTWQLPFAIIFCLLIAATPYLKFRQSKLSFLIKKSILPLIIGVGLTIGIGLIVKINFFSHWLLLGSTLLCISFIVFGFSLSKKRLIAHINHLGFGIFMLGVLITFSNKKTLYQSPSPFVQGESLMLVKNHAVTIDGYTVNYMAHTKKQKKMDFNIELKNNKTGAVTSLNPFIQLNDNMGNVYEPAVKKHIHKDIFAYITHIDIDNIINPDSFILKETIELTLHDTLFFANTYMVFNSFSTEGQIDSFFVKNFTMTADIIVHNPKGKDFEFKPQYIIQNNRVFYTDDFNKDLGVKLHFAEVLDKENTIELWLYEEKTDYLLLKIWVFPYINLMWFGVVVMFLGLALSVNKRIKVLYRTKVQAYSEETF